MTIVRGVLILAAPCCGARYAFPDYATMNFSAWEYWTDGWREHSLMPNDEGLRQCRCGKFLLLKHLTEVASQESSDLPRTARVSAAQLPECIAQAADEEVELAARLEYWRELNHAYRERYRTHRDAEEAAIKAAWEANVQDTRSWWEKLRKVPQPAYHRPANSPFTYPPFEPSAVQMSNMVRLSELLQSQGDDWPSGRILERAELYREQGRFEEAQAMIERVDSEQADVESRLIAKMIAAKETAPMRYRI